MAKELYDVCLTGQLLRGHNRREVTVNLAQLVGTTIPQAAQLLDTAPCLKTRVDQATAAYYHEILEETGAEAVIRACLAQARAGLSEDEPCFDLPPLAAGQVPRPAPPQLQPAQAIVVEATPVREEAGTAPAEPAPASPAAAEALPADDPQDTTQPFAIPAPAPLSRRRWPLWSAAALTGVALLAGVIHGLPEPPPPGHALADVGESLNLAQPFQQQVERFWQAQGRPPTAQDLQWQGPQPLGQLATLTLQAQGLLVIHYSPALGIGGYTLELQPVPGDQGFEWRCTGGTLSPLERPLECRLQDPQP